ncbi:hypothetical protein EDC02_5906 [Micromonospora sp. Llam0]|uniref:hypothetical protein n=1 Tax=Micromonospora sp. Llam0 TaxID=2485143 RepID=UPI000F496071|nr:hypothetical protein [Micromonospora sp. Llam0]ROO51042.1 hypothetical protein EDC02_5906 [Micromonospora sp. Llam0]
MSARHVSALRSALRQCCGGPAARTVLVRTGHTDPTGVTDPDAAAIVRVCAADLDRLMTELRGTGELTGYELSPPWAPTGSRCGAADLADGESVAAPDDHRAQLVAGLRQLADWYEANPGAPLPEYPEFRHCVNTEDDDAGRATVAEVAAALGVDHDAGAYRPDTTREFAGLTFVALYVPEEDMATYNAKQDAVRELVAAGWKPGDPVPTPAEDPMASGRDIGITVTPPPPGIEGISVSSPPSWSGRPVSAPPATVDPDPWHVGRASSGTVIEQQCGCRLAACGLVELTDDSINHACEHHPMRRAKTMRQMHRASQCPALGGPR